MIWVDSSIHGVGISIPFPLARLKSLLRGAPFSTGAVSWIPAFAGMAVFCCFLSIGDTVQAQEEDSKQILAFTEAWRGPQDYVWTRESLSKADPHAKRGIRIKDSGRIRIETLSYENESVVLDPHILLYRYETELPGAPVEKRVSPLEGVDLPLVWLHSVMGFSVGLEPRSAKGVHHAHQAGEVLEILDFRGFVPDATPEKGKKWSSRTSREADSTYAFAESVEREFECLEAVPEGEKMLCRVRFEELVKVTPTSKSRSSEIRERNGTFKVRMPEGLIEEVVWRSISTEYMGSGDSRRKIETETEARIHWREATESKPRAGRSKSENKEKVPPRPPR